MGTPDRRLVIRRAMPEYLVGLMYHEPEDFALWNRGVTEDYESTTAVYIEAESEVDALKWGHTIGDELLRHVTGDRSVTCEQFGYECWIEIDPPNRPGLTVWVFLSMFAVVRCRFWNE